MATTTDTAQLTTGQIRTDGIHDSQVASRLPKRAAGMATRDPSAATLSGERATGRLRPVSPSIHETVIPDRHQAKSPDLMRKPSPAEFSTAMSHFYRGEVQRSNTWRSRLDNTTYWAVLTVAGGPSFAFSSPNKPHLLIPIISILVAVLLLMGARRHSYYEILAHRLRGIATRYF